jgi:hypothetical protein
MIEPVVSAVIGDAEMFSAKVKFAAIITSAVLAYAGIMLSQWRTRVRENKAHSRSKYEDIVSGINELMFKVIAARRSAEAEEIDNELSQKLFTEAAVHAHKLDMLISIYTPDIVICADKHNKHANKIIDLVPVHDSDLELTRIKRIVLDKARKLI